MLSNAGGAVKGEGGGNQDEYILGFQTQTFSQNNLFRNLKKESNGNITALFSGSKPKEAAFTHRT